MKKYEPKYEIKELYTDTYAVIDGGMGQGKVHMYLLVGTQKALLVDSGYGLLDLPLVARTVTDKPVICVCTHGHLDHAPGACQFEEAYLHSKDFDVYSRHTDPELITSVGTNGLLMKPPKMMLKNQSYVDLVNQMAGKKYTALKALDDIESFDLGGRIVTWMHVPGHTQGSVAVVDESNKTIFDGDAAAPGAWLFLAESSTLPEYIAVLKKYSAFIEERGIERRYVGHTGKALGNKYLRQLIRCAEICEAKPNKGIKIKTMLGSARIVFAGGSLLFCGR